MLINKLAYEKHDLIETGLGQRIALHTQILKLKKSRSPVGG